MGPDGCPHVLQELSDPPTSALLSSRGRCQSLLYIKSVPRPCSSMGATINGQYTPLAGFQTVARSGFTDTNGATLGMIMVLN